MRRRELLKLGGAAALSSVAWATRVPLIAGTKSSNEPATSPSNKALTIGYWDGHRGSAVVSASGVELGDASFAKTGALVSFRGLKSVFGDSTFSGIELVTVDVAFSPFNDARFLAWNLVNTGYPKQSSSLSTVVPIAPDDGLTLDIGVKPSGGAFSLIETTFSPDAARFTPKLQDGCYFIALSGAAGAKVNWSDYAVDSDRTGAVLKPARHIGTSTPLNSGTQVSDDLIYFVLQVRHAS